METTLSSKTWWLKLEERIKNNHPESSLQKPVNLKVILPSGKMIEIKNSWYDILVLNGESLYSYQKTKKLILPENSFTLIEVKYSSKKNGPLFGAFTVGEWIAAYCSLQQTSYRYYIYLVRGNETEVKIDKLDLT